MQFRVLGTLEVEVDGQAASIPGGKARALLAILLLNANQVMSSDRLVDMLWGEDPPATAEKALQVHVSQLRKALGHGNPAASPIQTRAPGYELSVQPGQLDLALFSSLVEEGRNALVSGAVEDAAGRLRKALSLWRGSPLAEFTFEPFAQSEIARLEELRLAAHEVRFDAELALGRHNEVSAELDVLVHQQPLRERFRVQLMLALYRSGRQAEALGVYEDARRTLRDELGIDPCPELQDIQRKILEQDVGLEARAPAADTAALGGGPASVVFLDFPDGLPSEPAQELEALLRGAGGKVFLSDEFGLRAAFADAAAMLRAVIELQATLASAPGAPRLARVGMHTGDVSERDGRFVGLGLTRCARLLQLGHPAQVLLTAAASEVLGPNLPPDTSLRDLGEHRLPDLSRRERVFQLVHPDLPSGFPPLSSSDAAPNNLSLQLTSFVGRRDEMDGIKRRLDSVRLVTLTGSGGCGKSRLALQIGAELVPQFPGGVWMVELADVRAPELVAATVCTTLGLPEQPDRTHFDSLVEHARARSMLLILDNCEHLVDACAGLVVELLGACPGLRVLATSREVLDVPGESVLRVPSLRIPSPEGASPDALLDFESVRLFVDRAGAVTTDFTLSDESAGKVGQICRRLDGLPLAIELAAARLRSMTVNDVSERLDDRFRLLAGGHRGSVSRHQTLRAVMDWSYNLLPEDEAMLLSRLSVFAGGFNLAAAEGVSADESLPADAVLELLARLVDKSLVSIDRGEHGWRYRLLETVREYAWERLTEAGEAVESRSRHAAFFLTLAEQAEHELKGPDLSRWADRLEAERDNFRWALTWFEEEGLAERQLRLAAALWRYCYLRGRYRQGRDWLEAALTHAQSPPPLLLANALFGAGALAFFECDYEDAHSYCTKALLIFTDIGDAGGAGRTLNRLGAIERERGNYESAMELHEKALASFRATADEWEIANSLQLAGFAAWLSGDFERATALSTESVRHARALNDKERIAWALLDLGAIAHYSDEPEQSNRLLGESLALFEDVNFKEGVAWACNLLGLGALKSGELDTAGRLLARGMTLHADLNDRWRAASVLEALALMAHRQGEHERACVLLSSGNALRVAIGAPVPRVEEPDREATESALRRVLGAEGFEAAWAKGSELGIEEALAAVVPA